MEASVPGTSSATVSTERDPGNAVDIGASGAERRSRRRTAHPTTVSSIGARRSTPSARSESRALACPRSPGSKGWPGTPSPAGSNEPPPCVVDLAKAGVLASSSKSFKPTRSARSPVGRRGPVADPEFADFDCVELRQYVYEDGTEFHGGVTPATQFALTIRGVSSRNLWRNEADSETYCSVRRRHSITASDAANAFTSGSWTLR